MSPCEAMAGTVSDRKGKGGARAARLLRARLLSHIYDITLIYTRYAPSRPGGRQGAGKCQVRRHPLQVTSKK